MTKLSAVISWVLTASTILLLIIGGALLLFPPTRLQILKTSHFLGGGACDTIPLYDRQGRLHEIPGSAEAHPELPLYYGEAPLYAMGIKALDPDKPPDSCIFVDHFTPEEVIKGQPLYPLILNSTLSPQLGVGESTRLKVTAVLQSNFTGLGYTNQYLVHLEPGENLDLLFKLDAPQFKYSQDPRIVDILFDQPIELEWVIAPQDIAAGEQWIGVRVEKLSDNSNEQPRSIGDYHIAIEVQPTSPIDPRLLSLLSLLGSVFMGGLAVIKTIYDMLSKRSSPKQTKGKAKPKKPKID